MRVVFWIDGGMVFSDVWVEIMMVGRVISVRIKLLINGVDCGRCI